MLDPDATIVAIASPTSAASRGVVRISGQQTLNVLQSVGIHSQSGRKAHCVGSEIELGPPLGLINANVLVWPTNRSYTAQPSAEIHTFGSLPILNAVIQKLIRAGARRQAR